MDLFGFMFKNIRNIVNYQLIVSSCNILKKKLTSVLSPRSVTIVRQKIVQDRILFLNILPLCEISKGWSVQQVKYIHLKIEQRQLEMRYTKRIFYCVRNRIH